MGQEDAEALIRLQAFEPWLLPNIKASDKVSFATKYKHFYKIGFKDGRIFDYYIKVNRLCQNKPLKWFNNGWYELIKMI
jgi:hypothetical protein